MSRPSSPLHQGDRGFHLGLPATTRLSLRELFPARHARQRCQRTEGRTFPVRQSRRAWALTGPTSTRLADQLALLAIEVPASMIEGIFLDQCFNAGNRVVEHYVDQPAVVPGRRLSPVARRSRAGA